jgi:hypothetical protein
MNEFLKKRIDRKLEALPDERLYQVLDYIEFLESKYAERGGETPSAFQKLAETVEDTLRAGRMSVNTIRGTMDAMSAAGRVMSGLAAAGKSVVDQVAGPGKRIEQTPAPGSITDGADAPAGGAAPPAEPPQTGSASA